MAIALNDSQVYESGSGGYAASHTLPDLDCSGTNTYALAVGFNRNPLSDVPSWTFEGATPDDVVNNINTNVSALSVKGDIVNNAALTIVSNTPSYKLQAMIGLAFTGVDQTTPVAGTGSSTAGYGASGTVTYTGTFGNVLAVFVALKDDRTFTPSSCSTITSVTHADANMGSGFVGYVLATGGSQTIGATWTGDTNWVASVVEIAAAPTSTDYTITKDLAYSVQTTPSISLDFAYSVNASGVISTEDNVSITTEGGVDIITENGSTTADYTITKDLAYSVAVGNTIQKELAYSIATNSTIQKDLAYSVQTNATVTKDLAYSVQSTQSITKDLAYSVSADSTVQKDLAYSVSTNDTISLDFAYTVQPSSVVSLDLAYSVATQSTLQKDLAYSVAIDGTITKDLAYSVQFTDSIELDFAYTVSPPNQLIVDFAYCVQVDRSLSLDFAYSVWGTQKIQKAMASVKNSKITAEAEASEYVVEVGVLAYSAEVVQTDASASVSVSGISVTVS